MREVKSEIRNATLSRRDALPPQTRLEMSLQAADHARQTPQLTGFDPGTIVSGFLPIRSEIDARPLLAHLATLGADLCLPVVVSKTKIEFRQMVRGAPLVPCGFGTIGPDENAQVLDPQILIVPLSAFDARGGRLGYGAGHYDRAIGRLTEKGITPRLVGLAYSVQQVDRVPMEDHDQFLEGVLTEKGFLSAQTGIS